MAKTVMLLLAPGGTVAGRVAIGPGQVVPGEYDLADNIPAARVGSRVSGGKIVPPSDPVVAVVRDGDGEICNRIVIDPDNPPIIPECTVEVEDDG